MQDEREPNAQTFAPTRVPETRPGPEGGRRHANRLARTRSLADAAIACFLAKGIDGTTIDDVVGAADMAKGSFYRYFTNKEDLVVAIFRPVRERVVAAMDRCSRAVEAAEAPEALELAYAELAGDLLAVLTQAPEVIRLFLQERHGPPSLARVPVVELDTAIREHAIRMAEAGRTHGLLRPLDARIGAMTVVGAVHELLWQQFAGRGHDDPALGASELVEIVLHGVRAPAKET